MEENRKEEEAVQTDGGSVAEETAEQTKPKKEMSPKLKQFLQVLKFTGFSISAGVIQFLTTSTLFDWTHWLPYYAAFAIGLTLSVIWNFTFNRKFTFASAANVPLAMVLVVIYNLIIVVPLSLGGDKLAGIWGDPYGMVVTALALIINFITEFFWDKFIVFNDKVINKLEAKFKRKNAEAAVSTDVPEEEAEPNEDSGNDSKN